MDKHIFQIALAGATGITILGVIYLLNCIDRCYDPEHTQHVGVVLSTVGVAGLCFLAWLKR